VTPQPPHTSDPHTTTNPAVDPVATLAGAAGPVATANPTPVSAAKPAVVATTDPAAHVVAAYTAPDMPADMATDLAADAAGVAAATAGHSPAGYAAMAGHTGMAAMADQTSAPGARAAEGVAGLAAPAESMAGHALGHHAPGHAPGRGHAGEPDGPRGRWPVSAGLAGRLVGEFITFCSLALLMVGVGRWLARLGLGAPPPHGEGLAGGVAQNQIPGPISLQQFLSNIQMVVGGILGTLTVTFFLVGFARWIAAHEAEEYEAAKKSLKNSAKGFVGALLSTTIVQVLQTLVTGSGR
jgi:type IV secretion system pilin